MKVSVAHSKRRAFTLVEIMIVVLILGILIAIAVPNWVTARTSSRTKACIDNLRHIDAAKEQWAMATNAASGSAVLMSQIYPAYLTSQPMCPEGGTYTLDVIGNPPTCTIVNHVLPP
jgi:prepilin-type N-terminal cleavage/methylation domain-containing protein